MRRVASPTYFSYSVCLAHTQLHFTKIANNAEHATGGRLVEHAREQLRLATRALLRCAQV